MSFTSILLVALAMSADAFAAAIAKGAALQRPRWRDGLRAGFIFGVIETLTPLLGWLLGTAASRYVEAWDHWIAFILLFGLGTHMIYHACTASQTDENDKPTAHGFWKLALTGLATSIDALAVGVSLAFLDVHIVLTALTIGLATFVMVTLGVMLGRVIGLVAGRWAGAMGGLVLIGIGTAIVVEHLA